MAHLPGLIQAGAVNRLRPSGQRCQHVARAFEREHAIAHPVRVRRQRIRAGARPLRGRPIRLGQRHDPVVRLGRQARQASAPPGANSARWGRGRWSRAHWHPARRGRANRRASGAPAALRTAARRHCAWRGSEPANAAGLSVAPCLKPVRHALPGIGPTFGYTVYSYSNPTARDPCP